MSFFGGPISSRQGGRPCRLRVLALRLLPLLGMAFAGSASLYAGSYELNNVLTQYVQTSVTSHNGLPQNSVHTIAQSDDGYLWFGTEEGLVRYDGNRTMVFDRHGNPDLLDNNIVSVCNAEDGSLWAGTPSGVAHFRGGRFVSHTVAQSVTVRGVVCDAQGAVWVGTDRGLYTVSGNGTMLRPVPGTGLGFQVNGMVQGRNGQLWLAMETGLTGIEGGMVRHYGKAEGLPQAPIRAIAAAVDGSLWLAFDSEILHWNGGVLGRLSLSRFPGRPDVTALLEDSSGKLWIGFRHNGLAVVQNGQISRYTGRDVLQSDDVMTLRQDRDGNLWVGFADSGVVGFHAGLFNTVGDREGLSENSTWVALAARDRSIWAGTNNKGLDHLLPDGRVEHVNGSHGLPPGQVGALFEDADGSLWAGSETGDLTHIEGRRLSVYRNPARANTSLRCILRGPGGDLYLLYHAENGLVRFHNGRFETVAQNVPGQPTFALAAPDGSLWIASSHGGVSHWNGHTLAHFGPAEGLRTPFLTSMLLDRDGALWVGSSTGGLSRIRNGRVARIMPENGLFDYTVGAIVEDDLGYLWMSSNKGIFKVRRQELNDFAEGRTVSVHSIVYGQADGMRSSECNYGSVPSVARGNDGRLWFATTTGLASILPSASQARSSRPAAVLEGGIVDGRPSATIDGIVTGKGAHDVEFDFTAPDFTAPERTHFRFRLDGYDSHWNNVGSRRMAFYNRLPPGQYLFLVQASNGREWPMQSTAVPVILPPLFWQTSWFGMLMATLLLLSGIGVYQIRVLSLRQRSRTLQECVVLRTAELQDAIREAQAAQQALHEQATRDGLTRLWNRRYIFDLLCQESRRAERERLSLCVLMLDVDHFKDVNDTAGHLAGDRVLEDVGKLLAEHTRPYDYAGRYGGEEFLIVLCNCTLEAGLRRAETIREAIASTSIVFNELPIAITGSFGVAVNSAGKSIEAVLQEADQALYRAKQTGRNRVCSVLPTVPEATQEQCNLLAPLWSHA